MTAAGRPLLVLALLLEAAAFHTAPGGTVPRRARAHDALRARRDAAVAAIANDAPPNSFGGLGVRPELRAALEAVGVERPNALQQLAIPAALERENLVLGAQTGSGKTLTYLVPTMQSIKADEEVGMARAKPRRPRAIVLVPTRELALQVHGVAKALSHHAKLSVEVVHGGVPDGPQKRKLERPVDLLVATPGRLLKLMQGGALYLGDVRHVVLDEVDTMFDAGFGADLDAVLKVTTRDLALDARADRSAAVQHLAVGATHPAGAVALYDRWLRGARRLMIEGSHSVPTTLRQSFLVCNGPTAKVSALRDLLGFADEAGKPSIGRVVLFCNSQQSARFVDHTLSEDGYKTANYHGAVPANERASNFDAFVGGDAHILVTTDLAARGLDELDVAHVVQFDFAKSAADYVHRCGRTARAGKSGDVTSLVTKSDMELVRAIRDAQKRGGDLIEAGDSHQKRQRERATTELMPAARTRGGGGGGGGGAAVKTPMALFPDGAGISTNGRSGGGGGGGGSGGGGRGGGRRGASSAKARGGGGAPGASRRRAKPKRRGS